MKDSLRSSFKVDIVLETHKILTIVQCLSRGIKGETGTLRDSFEMKLFLLNFFPSGGMRRREGVSEREKKRERDN